MTTNKPELLDEPLILPGRVDVHVKFDYASQEQVRDLFTKMYSPYRKDQPSPFDTSNMSQLADTFAKIVPGGKFTPAEIQQYLLFHRVRPKIAVDGASDFVRGKLESELEKEPFAIIKPKFSEENHLLLRSTHSSDSQGEDVTETVVFTKNKRKRNRRVGGGTGSSRRPLPMLHNSYNISTSSNVLL